MKKQRIVAIFILVIFIPTMVLVPLWQAGVFDRPNGNTNGNPPLRPGPFADYVSLSVFLEKFLIYDVFIVTGHGDENNEIDFTIRLENNVEYVNIWEFDLENMPNHIQRNYRLHYGLGSVVIREMIGLDEFKTETNDGEYFYHPLLGRIYLYYYFTPSILAGLILYFLGIDEKLDEEDYSFVNPNSLKVIVDTYEYIIIQLGNGGQR